MDRLVGVVCFLFAIGIMAVSIINKSILQTNMVYLFMVLFSGFAIIGLYKIIGERK